MITIRTPAKKTSSEDAPRDQAASTSDKTSSVRRSIGEWEAGKTIEKSKTTPKKSPSAISSRAKPKPMPSLENKPTTLRKSGEDTASPLTQEKPKYANRVAEARAYLAKAKLHLNNSRNLKTDIKSEVTQAIERLYQLVKEAEMEKGQTENKKKKQGEEEQDELVRHQRKKEEITSLSMAEHGKLLKENSERIIKLQEILEHQAHRDKVTYASVAAGHTRRQAPEQSALHSVVITSKDETESGEEVLERVRRAVNAKEEGIRVDKVRKAKDRKIIIGCKTEEERNKIKERIQKAGKHLCVEDVKNKDPLLILKDVLNYNTDEDVLSALRKQNGNIFRNLDKMDDRLEIRYRKRTRNPHTSHIVIRVSPTLWNRILEAEALHIDMQRIRVADQSPLVQCSLCLGYGHTKRLCKEQIAKCSHCGGPHMKTECADWIAGAAPSCCNCMSAKCDSTEHNAFSQECTVRRRWEALARATISYC